MSKKIHQLEMFDFTPDEINANRIEEVHQSLTKVRKGTYANIGEINKRLDRIEDMFEHMIYVLCRGNMPDHLVKNSNYQNEKQNTEAL